MGLEIVLQCAHCKAETRYKELFVNGQFRYNHKLDCDQQHEEYPKMYLTQAKAPSNV